MIRYTVFPDTNGQPGDAYIISDFVNSKSLAANTPKSDTMPTGARFVLITSTATSYFRVWGGGTLAVPADLADGSAPELVPSAIPALRVLVAASTVGSITAGSALLTVDATDGLTIADTVVVTGAGAAGANLSTTVSAVNSATGVVTLAATASTTVSRVPVNETLTILTIISPTTAVVTLAYFK